MIANTTPMGIYVTEPAAAKDVSRSGSTCPGRDRRRFDMSVGVTASTAVSCPFWLVNGMNMSIYLMNSLQVRPLGWYQDRSGSPGGTGSAHEGGQAWCAPARLGLCGAGRPDVVPRRDLAAPVAHEPCLPAGRARGVRVPRRPGVCRGRRTRPGDPRLPCYRQAGTGRRGTHRDRVWLVHHRTQ